MIKVKLLLDLEGEAETFFWGFIGTMTENKCGNTLDKCLKSAKEKYCHNSELGKRVLHL